MVCYSIEIQKFSCNSSCSLITWSPTFRPCTPLTTGAPVFAGSPGAKPASLCEERCWWLPTRRQRHKLQTKPYWTQFCGLTGKHSFPTPHHKSVNSTQRHKGKNTSILLHNKAEKDMTKISSVSWFCFQEMLCSVMKGAQLCVSS